MAYFYVEIVLGEDIRRPGEVCNSSNLMLSIIQEVGTDVREVGRMSELDRNDTSVGDIITKLIQHVEANTKTEPESFLEISRAIRDHVRSLKECLPTEHDAHPKKVSQTYVVELLTVVIIMITPELSSVSMWVNKFKFTPSDPGPQKDETLWRSIPELRSHKTE